MVATLFLFIFWSSFFSLDLLDNIKMKSLQQPPIPQSDVVSRKRNISMFLFFPLEYLEEPCSEAPANNSNTSNYRDWVKTQVRQTWWSLPESFTSAFYKQYFYAENGWSVICDISSKANCKISLYANCDQRNIWLGKCKFIFYSFSISKYDLLTVFSCQTNQKTSQAEQRKLFYFLQEFCNLDVSNTICKYG